MNYNCPIYEHIQRMSHKSVEQTDKDLCFLVRKITGQRLSKTLVLNSAEKPNPTCLTRFFLRGAKATRRIARFIQPEDNVLEFGGGIGRLAGHLSFCCNNLVSTDVEPLTKEYGPILWDGINFVLNDELKGSYDFIYSIATFFHLPKSEKEKALLFIKQHLNTAGSCLIDLMLAEKEKQSNGLHVANESEFISFCSALFNIERVTLFNQGLLLTHKD